MALATEVSHEELGLITWAPRGWFPFPEGLACPQCRGTLLRASSWKFGKYAEEEWPWLCDVAFRCLECATWWNYRVPVDETAYSYHRANGRTHWRWQDVMMALEATDTTLFPNLTPDEVVKAVSERWDLTGRWPTPKWAVECPTCHNTRVQAQFWRFSRYTSHNGSNPYRCNVSMKCTRCSYVMMFGVFIPQAMYDAHLNAGTKSYHWREVRKQMEQESHAQL